MKRCFLVAGPPSSGNRLLAAILARAGCAGEGSTSARFNRTLPTTETPAVLIRHHPPAELFTALAQREYVVRVLACVRDATCTIGSQVQRHHAPTVPAAEAGIEQSWRHLFQVLPPEVRLRLVPYESLVLHPEAAAKAVLDWCGLHPGNPPEPLVIDGQALTGVHDANAAHYGCVEPRDERFRRSLGRSLTWLPELGMGWYPVKDQPYDDAYFGKYQTYAETEMGRALTAERVAFAAKHHHGPLVDVGIGCGQFIEVRGAETYGYDVNPMGVRWLKERELWVNPNLGPFPAASFWDSLEHIADPRAILDRISRWAFVSLPVFRDASHVLASKHFRKDEHTWYWTEAGFIDWMQASGWLLRDRADFEVRLGREDIGTFAFERVRSPWR